jgi:hypothetical protein
MADYDASNPYVREAVAAGVPDLWIATFLRNNPGDYHRIMAAASGDDVVGGQQLAPTSVVLTALPDAYQQQVRPSTALVPTSVPGAPLMGSLFGSGSPLLLVAVAIAAWFIYKRL